jgi:hypothetical protein
MTSVVLTANGDQLRLQASFTAPLPSKMSSRYYYMIVSFNFAGDAHHETVGLSAQATNHGWSVAAGNNSGTVSYPGAIAVNGSQLTLTFPWSLLGGPHTFSWSASSSWFDTGKGEGGYAEQVIPQASFPSR